MSNSEPAKESDLKQKIAGFTYRALKWGRDHVPPGIRSLIGILFVIGGIFGFLPILGFWMIPLGLAFIALDIPGTRHRIDEWIEKLRQKAQIPTQATTDENASADEAGASETKNGGES